MHRLASKTLVESKGDWDYFKLVSTIKAEDAWRPLEKGRMSVRQGLGRASARLGPRAPGARPAARER
jgi:branched-chain amino acid transport system substrate-binding protein